MRWGYAASVWALVFAGFHVYWAFGGGFGLGDGPVKVTDSAAFLAYDLVVTVLCLVGAVVALALEQRPEHARFAVTRAGFALADRLPRWMMLVAAWGAVVLLAARWALGLLPSAVFGLTDADLYGETSPSAYTVWSLQAVELYFLLGALLYGAALWAWYRRARVAATA